MDDGRALIFGLLLADAPDLREDQLSHLTEHAGTETSARARHWQIELASAHSGQKIALAEMAISPLRRLTPGKYRIFKELTRWLIASDGRVDLFEFMLQKLVERHLDTAHGLRQTTRIRHRRLADLEPEIALLLAKMAAIGRQPDTAYAAADEEYQEHTGRPLPPLSAPADDLSVIGAALDKCDAATPLVKRRLLRLCALAAASDGVLGDREVELLRAVADAIGCQIPAALTAERSSHGRTGKE